MTAPHRDDFARWIDDPLTRYAMAAFTGMADANKARWIELSWEGGACSPEVLQDLRIRADTYRAMAEMNYEAVCDANGDEPNEE